MSASTSAKARSKNIQHTVSRKQCIVIESRGGGARGMRIEASICRVVAKYNTYQSVHSFRGGKSSVSVRFAWLTHYLLPNPNACSPATRLSFRTHFYLFRRFSAAERLALFSHFLARAAVYRAAFRPTQRVRRSSVTLGLSRFVSLLLVVFTLFSSSFIFFVSFRCQSVVLYFPIN